MQVRLTEDQLQRLRAQSVQQHIPVAELIRRAVDKYLEERPSDDPIELRKRAVATSGRFRSTVTDVSIRHDDYLEEAYMD